MQIETIKILLSAGDGDEDVSLEYTRGGEPMSLSGPLLAAVEATLKDNEIKRINEESLHIGKVVVEWGTDATGKIVELFADATDSYELSGGPDEVSDEGKNLFDAAVEEHIANAKVSADPVPVVIATLLADTLKLADIHFTLRSTDIDHDSDDADWWK